MLMGSLSSLYGEVTAEDLLQQVRHSAVLQKFDMTGDIKKNGKKFPIHLFLRGKDIQFLIDEGKSQDGFHIRMENHGFEMREIVERKARLMPKSRLDDAIKGTDVTYEDLAMRFLYWKQSQIVGTEKVRLQECYKVRLINPDKGSGQYKIVYVWIHKKYGALMQVVGYNQEGKPLKRFAVTKLQRAGESQTLKKLQIDSIDPKNNKVTGQTYIVFDRPIPVNSQSNQPAR